ncbi:hypothetical protein O7607_30410 [Micromonospora sp. WMMA1949]|uniref:hypothetical protein n=1 Tax=Micromonospora sp. WMMA1949 TaxID=3015162 RepID=UPI0022B7067D|nr:hypothetical protein [Micromonospora sp. WMMA1949]MCZ7424105.1 hypothetical protein [Micromonospora sp. WMMA1949]MCZ7430064.1 hypothetical protein [Micromonospora sp. WMMA1949]MCZ7430085.1 hypothetical protein [Micromonospora sp. WMMA1949]
MFTSAILDLRLERNWEPGRLTAEAFRWPGSDREFPLRELATRLAPRSFADAGSPVVTPASVDPASGGVRRRSKKYQGSVFQVGTELRPGDVLVPRVGLGPAVLVSEHLRGALVAARFSALRPLESELGLWLWGLLSSESGRRLRANLSQGAALAAVETSSLLDATVPVPPVERLRRVTGPLRAIEDSTHVDEEEAVETWWQTTDLRTTEWRTALATPDPSILTAGEPLANFCREVVRGRNTRRLAIEEEAPGYLPVADVSMLGGKAPRRWVPEQEGNPTVAQPGDLLMAALGNLPHARIADARVVADSHVLVLRLRNPSLGPALAHYLNGQDAYRVRQVFTVGAQIPSISATDLGRIPVPAAALEPVETTAVVLPLAQRLELVLWES